MYLFRINSRHNTKIDLAIAQLWVVATEWQGAKSSGKILHDTLVLAMRPGRLGLSPMPSLVMSRCPTGKLPGS